MIINPELRDLIFPLTDDEYASLEKSLREEGCRDAIVAWDDTIVDGHNRYEICQKHHIQFNIIQKKFDDIEQVKDWMESNQLARRNLTNDQRMILIGRRYEREKKTVTNETGVNQFNKEDGCQVGTQPKTAKKIADEYNIGERTVHRYANAAKEFDKLKQESPELAADVWSGKKTLAETKKEKKIEDRKIYIDNQKRDIIQNIQERPNGLFDIIVVDPPWNYGREYDPDGGRVSSPYPEMNKNEIREIKIPSSENSILWLWTTHAFIWDAKELMDAWGFTYKAILTWDKENMGMGSWLRMQAEFCLLGIKGKPLWEHHNIRDVIREPRREHSRKPDSFYKMIDDNFIGKKLDYFSRSTRDGWESIGNEINKF